MQCRTVDDDGKATETKLNIVSRNDNNIKAGICRGAKAGNLGNFVIGLIVIKRVTNLQILKPSLINEKPRLGTV